MEGKLKDFLFILFGLIWFISPSNQLNASTINSDVSITSVIDINTANLSSTLLSSSLQDQPEKLPEVEQAKEVASTVAKEETEKEKLPDNAAILFWTQLVLLLVIIYFGIKFGGVGLGLLGGLGVTLLVFIYGAIPADPPIAVMLIILAVSTTSATLEATGALGLIVKFAERILRKKPEFVVYLAPMSTFFLTILVGTGHAVYPLLPVIYDVSIKKGIRPERPMAVAAVASQMGITASPISAAAAAMVGIFGTAGFDIGLIDILKITIPACFIGMLLAATWSLKRGKDLENDPEFQEKIKDPEMRKYIYGGVEDSGNEINKNSKISLGLFLLGIVCIVIIAMFPDVILPLQSNGKPIAMSQVLQFVMFSIGAVILFSTRIKAKSISDTNVFNAGMVAVIMIFGIAWMSETVIANNEPYILTLISEMVEKNPWTFAIAMFTVSMFLKSQAATLLIMLPLGVTLGLDPKTLLACVPACYAYYFFCFYPSDLAAINFDRSGTTHVGSWILNHSFMIPGLIGTWSAVGIAFALVNLL